MLCFARHFNHSIADNKLTTIAPLAAALRSCPNLTKLHIHSTHFLIDLNLAIGLSSFCADNALSDSSVGDIVDILGACPKLEAVWIDGNKLTHQQDTTLALAVAKHPALKEITCVSVCMSVCLYLCMYVVMSVYVSIYLFA